MKGGPSNGTQIISIVLASGLRNCRSSNYLRAMIAVERAVIAVPAAAAAATAAVP